MSLHGAFEIGRSALLTSQLAMRVAGNNMANAVTPGYARRTIHLSALQGWGGVGQGVTFSAARREIDLALQARFRDAVSRESGVAVDQQFLNAIEALQNELGETDLSSDLGEFFNSFSELSNLPSDTSLRSIILEQGQTLADGISSLRAEYHELGTQVIDSLESSVIEVNSLLDQIASLNKQIVEAGTADDPVLMDQRDVLLDELSQYLDVVVIQQSSGMSDVLIGSVPVVLGTETRGLELRLENGSHGLPEASLRVLDDGSVLPVTSGSIGGLLRQREDTIIPVIETLETFTRELIWQVNRLHSQGQGLTGYPSVTAGVAVANSTSDLNQLLDYPIGNGSFSIHLRDPESDELLQSFTIDVDGSSMSLGELAQAINAASGPELTAVVDGEGRLQIATNGGRELMFSDDSAGVLAALEINTFFSGSTASAIGINQTILDDPQRVIGGGDATIGSAVSALDIAQLRETIVTGLGDQSLVDFWSSAVGSLAVRTSAATNSYGSASLVRNGLSAQVQSVSGVSVDEESINLLTYERQYQAAARYLEVLDETVQTLLTMV